MKKKHLSTHNSPKTINNNSSWFLRLAFALIILIIKIIKVTSVIFTEQHRCKRSLSFIVGILNIARSEEKNPQKTKAEPLLSNVVFVNLRKMHYVVIKGKTWTLFFSIAATSKYVLWILHLYKQMLYLSLVICLFCTFYSRFTLYDKTVTSQIHIYSSEAQAQSQTAHKRN